MVLIGSVRSFTKDSVNREIYGKRIYEILGDNEEVLYVGVGNAKVNLKQHLPDGWFPIPEGKYYRIFEGCEDDSLLNSRKRSLISDYEEILGDRPKYNKKEETNDIG